MRTFALFMLLTSATLSLAAGPAVTNLPAGWAATDLGTVRKPGAVSYDAATRAFTIRSIDEATQQRGTFAFTRVKGYFVATARVTAASQKSVGAGLMMRTSTNSDARLLKNAFNGFRFGNGKKGQTIAWVILMHSFIQSPAGGWQKSPYPPASMRAIERWRSLKFPDAPERRWP